MKKSLLSIVFASCVSLLFAQQDIQLTQWQFERLSFNPAMAGASGNYNFFSIHRDQWDGFDHDPKTYLFNADAPLQFASKNFGAGLTFYSEVLGQQTNNVIRLSPSYHHNLGNNTTISGGLSLSLNFAKLGGQWVYIDDNDPLISAQGTSTKDNNVDFGIGFLLQQKNKYYIGLSATNLATSVLDQINIKLARHYYLMGGYEYPISSANIVLRPNLLVKSDFNSTQIDVNADAYWNDMLWGGLAYRHGDAICPYVGFHYALPGSQMGQKMAKHGLRVGYAYDVTTSEIRNYSSGSHEIFLHYYLGLSEIPIRAKHHDVRFL
jgi:type IX secretion system PorP/SprF family membrane protein